MTPDPSPLVITLILGLLFVLALLLARTVQRVDEQQFTRSCSCTRNSTRGAAPDCPFCGGRGVC